MFHKTISFLVNIFIICLYSESVQIYSFVLTSTDSKWRFGFCRHDANTSVAMVVITYLPWHDTFMKFLNILGELKKSENGEFRPFLTETYVKGIPEPGANLKLFYNAGVNVSPNFAKFLSYTHKWYAKKISRRRISCFNGRHNFCCPAYRKITI